MADPARDYSILRAAAALLEETGQFATCRVGERPAPNRSDFGAEAVPAAVLSPGSFAEADDWDDAGDVHAEREGSATLTLVVRDDEDEARIDLLDRLCSAACAAINGRSLAGATIPGKTRVSAGRWLDAAGPEKHLALTVRYSYLIPGYAAHDDGEYGE